ncbi:protein-(glutamine-N5) methyltransferase, release factor-specific [Sulfurihydrogenibium yellowstonense SS-5]|uniref:Release factor glutamine methyltransferase n=2 Tax=Sulfurihydrogenibium yellowstonense TaxID=304736 RepID=C4FIA5_9AQUI|nr:protein-(glutamine-N5) methyltransferase, release factor-specific [Sulfurihydrogenibium yellowstonense SS-5]
MKLKQLFSKITEIFKESKIENPASEASILISKILDLPKHYIISYPDLEISEEDAKKLVVLSEKRASGYPMAYLTKSKEFFGLDFYIEEGILIPRPETEILVEKVIEKLQNAKGELIGLEVGIGSGCISVSLLKNIKNLKIIGIDISEKALEITEKNAEIHGVLDRLKLFKFDIMNEKMNSLNLPKLDFVVSNPPYIKEEDYQKLQKEVKKEPKEALISGKEGTEFYEKIVNSLKDFLKEDGFFAFEVGIGQAEKVKQILEDNGYKNIEIYKDLAGIDRVIIASKRFKRIGD